MLVKHVSYIKEMQEHLIKEKIQRVLHLKNKIQYKIKEFSLVLRSLVLIKNLVIKLSADRKIKPCYLSPIIVILQLKREVFVLVKLDRFV